MKKLLLSSLILFSMITSAETQWKMATPYDAGLLPDKTHHYFAQQISEKTAGNISISVHPSEELAKHERIMYVVGNSEEAQLGEVLGSFYSNRYPVWELDSLPFLADSYEKAEKLWQASREQVVKDLEQQNLLLLYVIPWPGQNFFTKERLDNISVLEGKNMLAYNDALIEVAKLLHANPITEYSNKIREGFETGNLDTMMMSPLTSVAAQMWNYTKYQTKVNAFFPKDIAFISKTVFDNLDETTQQQVMEAAQKAQTYAWELSKAEYAEKEDILVKNGMISETPEPQVRQAFFKIGQKLTLQWYAKASQTEKDVLKAFRGY